VLLALAATAISMPLRRRQGCPDLIVGHGVLGRLLARVAIAAGCRRRWSGRPTRSEPSGAEGYDVVDPETDERRDYRAIYDVSGDSRCSTS
jgi:3-hydroxyethyl bacteriochlorophyllide a dehydrogenase